jgi:DNA helicase-2/ATP-dependent DNA helicase PcrA|tara:strand:- start:408 stop:1883 length:1476 start_codon:yes stop_codon:yes gene_type:complete
MQHKNLNIVLGPPGTGKTTKLLNLVEQHLNEGVRPEHIGYLAFTRKAADEAAERAFAKFNYTREDLPYFRTIHSLCFQQLNLKRSDVMTKTHYQELGDMLGLEVDGGVDMGEGQVFGMRTGDKLFFLENMARVKQKDLKEIYNEYNDDDINWFELERLSRALVSYKEKRKIIDYTDMLMKCLKIATFPKLRILFVDEAQDLSAIQWSIINEVGKETEVVYIAGDDDQAIYRWAGADVNQFIKLEGKSTVLNKSYRVPSSIWDLATKLSLRISSRIKKEFKPTEETGEVRWYMDPEDVDISQGTWYLLARNGYMLNQLENICIKNGYPFTIVGRRSPLSSEALQAIRFWTRLSKGESIVGSGIKLIYKYMVTRCPRGINPEGYYTISDFNLKPGIWHERLNKIDTKRREYYIMLLKRGENLDQDPRIKISTIHGVKGGEADNVMLLTDIAPRTFREMHSLPDDEIRVFYVAVTRAKKSLHIVQPNTNMYFDL